MFICQPMATMLVGQEKKKQFTLTLESFVVLFPFHSVSESVELGGNGYHM